MSWNDKRIELLKELWDEGLSCSQIAARLGRDVSRNAVIGKASRLGLPRRACSRLASTSKRPRKPRPRPWRDWRPKQTPVSALFAAKPFAPTYIELVIPECERKTLMQLGDADCRWPCNNGEPDYQFCARPKVDGLPYCKDHARVAYAAPMPRGRQSRPNDSVTLQDQLEKA